MQETGQSS
jgi:hypothetical protein